MLLELTISHHHDGLLECSPVVLIDICSFLNLERCHVREELRDVIGDRQRLVPIHKVVPLVLVAHGEQNLLQECQMAKVEAKVVTYSVHLTLGKRDSRTLDNERAIDDRNEDICAIKRRASKVIVCSLESRCFHRLYTCERVGARCTPVHKLLPCGKDVYYAI